MKVDERTALCVGISPMLEAHAGLGQGGWPLLNRAFDRHGTLTSAPAYLECESLVKER
jgi:hypothetical protein